MATGNRKPPAGKAAPARPVAKAPAGEKNVAAALARKPSRKTAKDILVLELRRLRTMFTEIAAVVKAVEGKSLPAARVEKMLRVLHDLSVKPRKGRRKDLTRIGKATASLRKEMGR